MASRSMPFSTMWGAPANPRGGFRLSMVTWVIAPSRAPLTPSSPAMAPEGTRIRQPCFSASRVHSSRTPRSPPTESTMRCFPAARTAGANSRSAACVAASTMRSDRWMSSGRETAGNPLALAGSRTWTPARVTPGIPAVMARAMWVPITPIPTMPTFSIRTPPPRRPPAPGGTGRGGAARGPARPKEPRARASPPRSAA